MTRKRTWSARERRNDSPEAATQIAISAVASTKRQNTAVSGATLTAWIRNASQLVPQQKTAAA